MYWEVPKEEMLQSLTWAMDLLGKGKTELFFSLAKGGLNELDRVGTASSNHFVVVTGRQVKTYVEFELFDNCFFTMGPLIMLQGTTGIPIGGFLSAQLTELWCIWREVTAMRRDCRVKTEQAFAVHCTDHFALPATLHLADPSDFSMSPDDQGMISETDIQRSTNVPEVTHDVLVQGGFQGRYSYSAVFNNQTSPCPSSALPPGMVHPLVDWVSYSETARASRKTGCVNSTPISHLLLPY